MEEDRNTLRALDELADLFLSDVTVNRDSTHTDASASAPAADAAATAPGGEGPDVITDELVGPEPVRLAPKVPSAFSGTGADRAGESQGASMPAESPSRESGPPLRLHRDYPSADADADEAGAAAVMDAEADPLDTAVRSAIERKQGRTEPPIAGAEPAGASEGGTATAERPTSGAAAAGLRAEAVLMGNLPGLSGPWLTQYGQLLAQHVGSVVMLHVDDERIDAELIEPTDLPHVAGRTPPSASRGVDVGRPDLIARLESLMEPGPGQVRAIVVHTEASPRPEALDRLKALDRWTLLCGADDAAVIAGYRLIKTMVEADATAAARQMGVMILGSEASAARAAAQKLAAATRPVLDEPVRFVGCQRQMVPVNLRQLGRFGPTSELWPRLAAWLADTEDAPPLETPLTASEHASTVNPADLEAVAPAAPASDPRSDASPADATAAETTDADWSWLREAAPPEPEAAATHGADAGHAPDAASDTAAPHEHEDELNLAQFLTTGEGQIAGGIALEARCPNQPRTQLVLDQRGRLHLLRRHANESSGASASESLRSAVVDLLEARKWVLQHIALLALTQRQCHFDTTAEPTLHLFTDRADLATGLIARLGDTLRIHLLKQVRVGERSTWFCTPLQS